MEANLLSIRRVCLALCQHHLLLLADRVSSMSKFLAGTTLPSLEQVLLLLRHGRVLHLVDIDSLRQQGGRSSWPPAF